MVTSSDILNANILVVNDKDANIRLIEGMLRVAGYGSVHSTKEPRAVCDLHRQNHYDLILLDLQMPGMDGFEVMESLQEIEQDGYLPVLVITAQPNHKLRALESGAKDFLSKPFELAELRARVHNILEVRLLHLESNAHGTALEETVRQLEASREIVRLKTQAEQERNEKEFALAEETQRSLLPRVLPQFENYSIHAFNRPTRYVGGDFYDFLQLSKCEWTGVLADVSGKGMSAALLSSMVLGAINMEFRSGVEPQEMLKRVNQLLCDKSLPYQFVTLFLFSVSPDGAGQFISAGQNPAYLFRAATGRIKELAPDAFALGMFEFATFESRPLQFDPGDVMVVYSDGLTDAENPAGAMFGEQRLLELIRAKAPLGGLAVEQSLLREIEEFTEGMPQTDDITFIVIGKNA